MRMPARWRLIQTGDRKDSAGDSVLDAGQHGPVSDPRLRLMDLLATLSLATDLGMGQPPETALRCCVLATRLGRAMALPEVEVRDVCLGSLLRHLGCTATAAVEARLYGGDELVSRAAAQPADFGDPREMLALTLATGRGGGGSPGATDRTHRARQPAAREGDPGDRVRRGLAAGGPPGTRPRGAGLSGAAVRAMGRQGAARTLG